ncbi:MAG: VWA domain-containing protein [Methanobrevibacter sp.]|nr:VWA domain-containing protein [Methanobrevibacter sp.]
MRELENISSENVDQLIRDFSKDQSTDMDIIFVIDRSGSMAGSERSTINGFNSLIERESTKDRNTRITTVLFDHNYEVLYTRKPVRDIKPLTNDDYFVRGSTALYDAVGMTIQSLKNKVSDSVLFIIITDGMENSSREFARAQIKDYIDSLPWEFVFVGAEIDSYREASNIGIKMTHTANFEKTAEGLKSTFDAFEVLSDAVYSKESIDDVDWKRNLEK